MYAITGYLSATLPLADTQPREVPFLARRGPPPRAPQHRNKRVKAQLPPEMRRPVTAETVRKAALLMVHEKCRDLRTCAKKFGVSEWTLSNFVNAEGKLTDLGRKIDTGTLLAPGDREAAKPAIERKTVLKMEDFDLADKLLGRTVGRMSRTLFCDLFGYDYGTVFRAYGKYGSITAWGREQRDAALALQAEESSQAGAAGGNLATPVASQTEAAERRATEECLSALATREGIALGYWADTGFRRLGKAGARFAGDVDRTRGHWRIRPAPGGEYRLAHGPHETEHIVNILRLHGHPALNAAYDLWKSEDGRSILAMPKPAVPPIDLPPAAADAS